MSLVFQIIHFLLQSRVEPRQRTWVSLNIRLLSWIIWKVWRTYPSGGSLPSRCHNYSWPWTLLPFQKELAKNRSCRHFGRNSRVIFLSDKVFHYPSGLILRQRQHFFLRIRQDLLTTMSGSFKNDWFVSFSSEMRAFKRSNFLINEGERLADWEWGNEIYSSAQAFRPWHTRWNNHQIHPEHHRTTIGVHCTRFFCLSVVEHILRVGGANVYSLFEGLRESTFRRR